MFGPRHLDFHPNGKWLYLSNEYAANVSTFAISADGKLTRRRTRSPACPPTSPCASGSPRSASPPLAGSSTSGNGCTNRSPSLRSTRLRRPQPDWQRADLGKTPRNFALDATGKWLVVGNQESNSLVLFKVNTDTGLLEKTAGPIEQSTPYVHLFVQLP